MLVFDLKADDKHTFDKNHFRLQKRHKLSGNKRYIDISPVA